MYLRAVLEPVTLPWRVPYLWQRTGSRQELFAIEGSRMDRH
jgi:hypothetical protein